MPLMKVTFQLPAIIKKERGWYIAICPILDVVTQGKTQAQAKKNLGDALYLFLTSCIERGTLNEVLKQSGFHPSQETPILHDKRQEYINVPLSLLSQKSRPQHCLA